MPPCHHRWPDQLRLQWVRCCLQNSMILLGTWLRSEAGRSRAYTGASWLFDCMTAYAWWQPLMLASCKQLWQWVPPFHFNSCCTIPPFSSSDHKRLLVSLHNDGVIERPLSNSLRFVWCYSQANFDLACDLLNESDWKERPSWSAWTNWRWPTQDLRVWVLLL